MHSKFVCMPGICLCVDHGTFRTRKWLIFDVLFCVSIFIVFSYVITTRFTFVPFSRLYLLPLCQFSLFLLTAFCLVFFPSMMKDHFSFSGTEENLVSRTDQNCAVVKASAFLKGAAYLRGTNLAVEEREVLVWHEQASQADFCNSRGS